MALEKKHRKRKKGDGCTKDRKKSAVGSDSLASCSTSEDDYRRDAIPTRTVYREQLKIGILSKTLTLVEGPIGSGKTALVKEVAEQLGFPCRSIQMSDQIDSKSLFGTFQCYDVPGEFTWKPSTFTKYIQEKGIILLEDLDSASADLISCLLEFYEKRKTNLVSGRTVELHEETYFVATVTSPKYDRSYAAADVELLLSTVYYKITLPAFTDEELHRVVCVLYERVAPYARKLMFMFRAVCSYAYYGKKLTPTDLFRACARLGNLLAIDDPSAVLSELLDVWAMHCQRHDDLLELSRIISDNLSINRELLNHHIALRVPPFTHNHDEVICGRAKLAKRKSPNTMIRQVTCFGMTREVSQLLERIAVCVRQNEPVLLVGETGIGKTAIVQFLAAHMGTTLRVVNLSQHSDSTDLIGGFKPVSVPTVLEPLINEVKELFAATFDVGKNEKFLHHMDVCLSSARFREYLRLVSEVARKAYKLPSKTNFAKKWANIAVRVDRCEQTLQSNAIPFAYITGAVAKAAELGDWLLVDEINLATSECLDSIIHLVQDPSGRHPDFRLFACMNPANDTGKRNLPFGVRSRFTELFVHETSDMEQLHVIGKAYLPTMDAQKMSSVLELYQSLCTQLPGKYSLRTLCRALSFAAENAFGSESRSLYEAVSMTFLSDLETDSRVEIEKVIEEKLGKVAKGTMVQRASMEHVEVEGYYVTKGSKELQDDPCYIRTASVKKNLAYLARIVCSARYPVLLEGETSAGKTAMVIHLAKITGNAVIRINNHDHTDLQEYVGSYVPDENGRLVFMEGPLVKAVREGDWVILDELNLAPSDVLEALNRLLDDNRELYISETNVVLKAHPQFRLFATQNPFSSYSGRKRLSRALLNRFIVLRFDHLPPSELSQMLIASCKVPPSAAKNMVEVMCKLREVRSKGGIFLANDGLMTLRDLFRWGRRLAGSDYSDWKQCLIDHGYFLLGARCRNAEDEESVKRVLEEQMARNVDSKKLFSYTSSYLPKALFKCESVGDIVLTHAIRRMIILTAQAWQFDEPVLLVGETGCGKTSVAQIVAQIMNGLGCLLTVNCHERTEAADLLGSLRPVGDGTFKWMDGVVVRGLKEGQPLLIDEISLANDSVLERLNPLLEPERTLLLTDAGLQAEVVVAKEGFNIVATMNPGNDYGKKELSKALRNRFTEVWCPAEITTADLAAIVSHLLKDCENLGAVELVVQCIVEFVWYFNDACLPILGKAVTIRDVVSAVDLFCATLPLTKSIQMSIYHAFAGILFDAMGTQQRTNANIVALRERAQEKLCDLLCQKFGMNNAVVSLSSAVEGIEDSNDEAFQINSFFIPFGPNKRRLPRGFTFSTPTCKQNLIRIARALAINKPILLEGVPGCGKSSTVVALAAATGHTLTRLNLSEQTDLADLFGCDVPVVLDDGTPSFAWKDGPVLSAIKNSHWVLLDEMNLASQSVLEGLNACFDFRHQLYIPELGRTFDIGTGSAKTRFFACQNPSVHGGCRRTLPKSFVNRFTSIHMEELTVEDYSSILKCAHVPTLSSDVVMKMVMVNFKISQATHEIPGFAHTGGPFEFNLRDLLRWADIVQESGGDVEYGFDLLYVQRLRTINDRRMMREIFKSSFGFGCTGQPSVMSFEESLVKIGGVQLKRNGMQTSGGYENFKMLSSQMSLLERIAACVKMNWLTLLVGKVNSGKKATVQNLARLMGTKLYTLRLTSESDALELLGSFEQVTDDFDFPSVKRKCLEILESYSELTCDIDASEDALSLRLAVQSAILLVKDDIAVKLKVYEEQLKKNAVRFQWVNSCFVEAYRNGDWILIENVNCCSAAVLDRLNVCLEGGGELVLSESGDGATIIKAHENFRVFFTMDCDYGTLSRAMRNRSVEIYVLENVWYKTPQDALDIVFQGAHLKDATMQRYGRSVLKQLDANKLMKLKLLLTEFDFESAAKQINASYELEADIDAEDVFVEYPIISDSLHTNYDKWKLEVWSRLSAGHEHTRLLWAALSISLKKIALPQLLNSFYDEKDVRCLKISEFLQKEYEEWSASFYDERFDGLALLRSSELPRSWMEADKFVVLMMTLWTKLEIDSITCEENSAMDMSLRFDKKQIRTDQLPAQAISHIAGLVQEFIKCLSSENTALFTTITDIVIDSLWDLILFIRSCNRRMSIRTSCAPVHLAWQRMHDCLFIYESKTASLCRLVSAVDSEWLVDDPIAVNRFNNFYVEFSFAFPYESEDEWQNILGRYKALEDICTERNERLKSLKNKELSMGEGVFDNALRMVNNLCCSFAMLNYQNKNILDDITSIATHYPVTLFHLSLVKSKSCEWSRIAYFFQFLASDFLAAEFTDSLKNVDILNITSGIQIYSSVWHALHFKTTPYGISLARLRNFATQRNEFLSLLWKIGPHLQDLSSLFKDRLYLIVKSLERSLGYTESDTISDMPLDNFVDRLLRYVLVFLRSSVPVKNMVDPVISDEMNLSYLKNKLTLIDSLLSMLRSYYGIISGQTTLKHLKNSQHPLIATLIRTRERLSEGLEEYRAVRRAFRPNYTDFSSLVASLHSFLENVLAECLKFTPSTRNCRNMAVEDLKIMQAQMEIFLTLLLSFYNRTLSEYTAFPDIFCPFFMFLNMLVSAVSFKRWHISQAVRFHELQETFHIPETIMLLWDDVHNRPSNDDLYKWCISEVSPMPKSLQATLVTAFLREKTHITEAVSWIDREWSSWYIQNTAKEEKMYEYRSRKAFKEESPVDEENFFPDFSALDNQGEQESSSREIENGVMRTEELSSLLFSSAKSCGDVDTHMALAWLVDTVSTCSYLDGEVFDNFLVCSYAALRKMTDEVYKCDIDVYHESSPVELTRCVDVVSKLVQHILVLREQWPEVTSFDDILFSAQRISNAAASIPQMHLCALVERLITDAEVWEKVADKKHSLIGEIEELRRMLVDWRKMEVMCWDRLLEQVHKDINSQALLVSWPLFESLCDLSKSNEMILAMAVQWIQDSTLLDFDVRLTTVRLMVKYIEWKCLPVRSSLMLRLKSVAAHFSQFTEIVHEKLSQLKAPIEKQLKDFVKIMKFHDLNTWSVQQSTRRAHQQLSRYVKKFKLLGNESVKPNIDDYSPLPSPQKVLMSPEFVKSNDSCNIHYAKKAEDLTLEMADHIRDLLNIFCLNELIELAADCNELIRENVRYDGDDDAKEKQQGRALDERQKAVSLLLRKSISFGLRSRKGLTLDTEELTTKTLADVTLTDTLSEKCIRQAAAARDVVLKKFHKPNSQLKPETLRHLKGLTEFILNELYLSYETFNRAKEQLNKLDKAKQMLLNYRENVKYLSKVDNNSWLHILKYVDVMLNKMCALLEIMATKLENAPDKELLPSKEFTVSGLIDTPLAQLSKSDPIYYEKRCSLYNLHRNVKPVHEQIKSLLEFSNGYEGIIVWRSTDLSQLRGLICEFGKSGESGVISAEIARLLDIFPDEVCKISNLLENLRMPRIGLVMLVTPKECDNWDLIEMLLLCVQSAYKKIMAACTDSIDFMHFAQLLRNVIESVNISECVKGVWELCAKMSENNIHDQPDVIAQVISICSSIINILNHIVSCGDYCLYELTRYYLHFEAMSAKLLEKGYVNQIAKPQREDEQDGKGDLHPSDDIAGMGDAQGDKDVGDQMDNMAQVEGLKGDDERKGEDPSQEKIDNDLIDLDDDFAADLENVDRDDEEDTGDDEDLDADKELGEVEQSEEDKLDPELWDKTDDDKKDRDIDEDGKGANKTTGELAANNIDQNVMDVDQGNEDRDDNLDNDDMENVDETEPVDANSEEKTDTMQEEDDNMGSVMDKLDDEVMDEGNEDGSISNDENMNDIEEKENEHMEEAATQNNTSKEDEMDEDVPNAEETFKSDSGGLGMNTPENDEADDGLSSEEKTNKKDVDESTNEGEAREGNDKTPASAADTPKDNNLDSNTEKDKVEKKSETKKDLAKSIDTASLQKVPKALSNASDKLDEQSHEDYGYLNHEIVGVDEQLIIDKGSVEEARISKARMDELQNLITDDPDIQANLVNAETEEKHENVDLQNADVQSSIIHTATDLYYLTEPSTSSEEFIINDDSTADTVKSDTGEQWAKIANSVGLLAAELCENLRMILEPTRASRLEGDYRTGKRLNMRRLIAYIASGYRKDAIWLRRTKRAQRNYQIMIAVDDSASMHDNNVKLRACQSVAAIENAFRRLEVGQLAVCKFGESVRMISDFGTHSDPFFGQRLLSELTFQQDRTNFANLLNYCKKAFDNNHNREQNERMLIIVSDGRGVFADGVTTVIKALSALHSDGVTVLFVAVDNGKQSLTEIKFVEFTSENRVSMVPYLQKFPFPFYIVLRHISILPATLGDAIRQWFELTAHGNQ